MDPKDGNAKNLAAEMITADGLLIEPKDGKATNGQLARFSRLLSRADELEPAKEK